MKIAVIGTGLIGGSLALALKQKGFATHVLGVDNNAQNLEKALQLGIIDEAVSLNDIYENTDLIILSIPVSAIEKLLPEVLDHMSDSTTVVDLGSTKEKICISVEKHSKRNQFVAAHPIAGTENAGPEAVIPTLFENKQLIICEAEKSRKDSLSLVKSIFEILNMKIFEMEPAQHDLHIAYVSHLSHISSFSLAQTILDKEPLEPQIFTMAGGGFSSTTRLAKSSAAMWTPIIQANKENILLALNEYIKNLQIFREAIAANDTAQITEIMKAANKVKDKLKQ